MNPKLKERLAKISPELYKKVRKELICEYYCNGGECAKGLPGTPCDLNGCVAWRLADWAREAGIKEE